MYTYIWDHLAQLDWRLCVHQNVTAKHKDAFPDSTWACVVSVSGVHRRLKCRTGVMKKFTSRSLGNPFVLLREDYQRRSHRQTAMRSRGKRKWSSFLWFPSLFRCRQGLIREVKFSVCWLGGTLKFENHLTASTNAKLTIHRCVIFHLYEHRKRAHLRINVRDPGRIP